MAFKAVGNTLVGNSTAEKQFLQNDCKVVLLTSCPGVGLAGRPRLLTRVFSIYFSLRPGKHKRDCHCNLV